MPKGIRSADACRPRTTPYVGPIEIAAAVVLLAVCLGVLIGLSLAPRYPTEFCR